MRWLKGTEYEEKAGSKQGVKLLSGPTMATGTKHPDPPLLDAAIFHPRTQLTIYFHPLPLSSLCVMLHNSTAYHSGCPLGVLVPLEKEAEEDVS